MDATLMEQSTACFYGGKDRDLRFKELSGVLWPGGGQRRRFQSPRWSCAWRGLSMDPCG